MKKKFLILSLVVVSLFAFDLNDGKKALENGKYEKAIEIFTTLSRKGDMEATFLLGKTYFKRALTSSDFVLARKYFEKSNYPATNIYLAKIYQNGLGVKKDIKKAVKYLVDSDLPEAKYLLAKLYLSGKEVLKDRTKAKELLKEAAKDGYGKAQLLLGELYVKGKDGFDRNLEEGSKWIKRAYYNGVEKSKTIWDKYKLWRYDDEDSEDKNSKK